MAEARWIYSRERSAGTFAWMADGGRETGIVIASLRFSDVAVRGGQPGETIRSAVISGLSIVSRNGETIPSIRPFKWEADKSLLRDVMTQVVDGNPGEAIQACCMVASLNAGAPFGLANADQRVSTAVSAPQGSMAKLQMFRQWQQAGKAVSNDATQVAPLASEFVRDNRIVVQPVLVNVAIQLGMIDHQMRGLKSVRVGTERDGFYSARLFASEGGSVVPAIFADAGVTEAVMPKELADMIDQVSSVDIDAARNALSSVSFATPHAVAWYGDRMAPSNADRRQAAASMPVLAGLIAASPAIAAAVDRRQSLQPLIISRTGLSKGGLKRISKITEPLCHGVIFGNGPVRGQDAIGVDRLRTISLRGRFNEEDACRILARLEPGWVPEDNRSWAAFRDVCSAMVVPLSQVLGADPVELLQASRGKWVEFRDGLARSADIDPSSFNRERIALSTIDAIQIIDELSRHIIIPLVLNTIAGTGQPIAAALPGDLDLGRNAAWYVVVGNGNAKNQASALFEVARRWASRIPSLDAILRPGGREEDAIQAVEREQPMICGPFQSSNGRVVRNLRNADMLVEESARLGHCVGRLYLRKSYYGDCHIFSIQDATGQTSYSTIEFMPIEDPFLKTVQHRARRNANPSKADRLAVSEFVAAVRSGAFTIDIEAAISWRDHVARMNQARGGASWREETPKSSWQGVLGCDWENQEMVNGLWNEWKDIIGDKWAVGETSGILFKAAPVRDLVEAFSPAAAAILKRQQAEKRAAAAVNQPTEGPAP